MLLYDKSDIINNCYWIVGMQEVESSRGLIAAGSVVGKGVGSYVKEGADFNRQDNPRFDYGIFNRYKLDDLINIQSDGFNQNQVLRFAFVENHALHLQESILALFQKYAKYEIAFFSIYGRQKAGKSLLLDKVLNLSEFQGGHFSKVESACRGIYLWNTPFTKGNVKIFMLDIQGYSQQPTEKSYVMLLSLLMLLSSSLVLLAAPADLQFKQLASIYSIIRKSLLNFTSNSVEHIACQLYLLYRQNSDGSNRYREGLSKYFANTSVLTIKDAMSQKALPVYDQQELKAVSLKRYDAKKNILNEEYLKKISSLMRDIHSKITYKTIQNLRFTGSNLIKICLNTIHTLNINEHVHIETLFLQATKELYQEAYTFHVDLYNHHLSNHFRSEEPHELDALIKIFSSSNQAVYSSFTTLTTNPSLREKYLQKIEKYINNKEKVIIAINKKKYEKKMQEVGPDLNISVTRMEEVMNKMKKSAAKVQGLYIEKMIPQMTTVIRKVQEKSKERRVKDMGIQLQRECKAKESYLKDIIAIKHRDNQVIIDKQLYHNKDKELTENINTIRTQIAKSRDLQSKRSGEAQRSPSLLKKELEWLKNQIRDKEKIIKELKSHPDNRKSLEMISSLNSQIQTRINQQKELEQLMASNVPKINSVGALKSVSSVVSPRKVESRVFSSKNGNIKIISSPKI